MKLRIDDIDLFYETIGAGLPLMTMHGGMGFDHTYFRPWLDPLAEKFKLIYYDHRGNGRSSPVHDFRTFDPSIWVSDAEKLRIHSGDGKIVLFGHSVGGFVAQEYALRCGDRLAGLILCNSAPALDYSGVMLSNARSRATEEQYSAIVRGFTEHYDNETFRKLAAGILPVYFNRYREEYGRRFVENTRFNADAIYYCSSTWFPAFTMLSRLGDIKVPTLVIAGSEDWITPPAEGPERLHAGIRGSELVVFEESGHFPFIEEQDRFIKVVGDWIDRLT